MNMRIINLYSFGYRFGSFEKGDENFIIYDARKGIFNPFYIAEDKTGLNKEISDLVLKSGGKKLVQDIIRNIFETFLITKEGNLHICVGCIGGIHRSVAIVERLGQKLNKLGFDTVIIHRDIDK